MCQRADIGHKCLFHRIKIGHLPDFYYFIVDFEGVK